MVIETKLTQLATNLKTYGLVETKIINLRLVKKIMLVIAILPLFSAWLFVVLPFIKNEYQIRKIINLGDN